MPKAKIGLIGIIGDEARKDYWGTLAKVADIGYRGIEGAGQLLEGNVEDNLKRFHDLGLQVLAVSASRDQLQNNLDKVISNAKILQAPRVCVWWGACETKESLLEDAELYNKSGAKLAFEGLKLCYHNHNHEFLNYFNGVYALDILAEYTDPEFVFFELDIAWVTFGGEDPVKLLKRMEGRVPAIHVKDICAVGTENAQFTAVGTGVVKTQESVKTAIDTGVEWVVVEQDRLRNLDAFETLTVSYLNLKEAGLV
ncbi:TIM barrel protein [Candidatus Poribacteria bacterium]|nr:TIM barrel protein [Candidatus Poribacteria bacterium]